jgi:O-antigen/teichoic acid export membrane protein
MGCAPVIRSGVSSLALKLASGGIGFALAVLLARALGPSGYGLYAFVFALVSLMAIPVELGLPHLVVRETARAHAREQWGLMRGIWRWAALAAGSLAVLIALVVGALAWALADRFSGVQLATFAWGLLLVPLIALGNLAGAALRGLQHVIQGQLSELVIRPAAFLLLVAGVLLWGPGSLAADSAMALHAAAAACALAAGAALLARERPESVMRDPVPVYETRRWLHSALPLALVAGMHLVHQYTDLVMLGLLVDNDQVGIYRVAAQAAAVVAFGLNAMNMVVAPRFAHHHATGDTAALQWTATFSARVILMLTLPVVAALALLGEPVIRLVFGPDYSSGYAALAILAVGQLGNAIFGSVAFLLNMTGHERDTARGLAVAVAVNVVLNLLLIPLLGLEGAALATTTTLVLWNVLLWRAVRRRLGIDSTAMGARSIAPSPK